MRVGKKFAAIRENIEDWGACEEAVAFLYRQSSTQGAWDNCTRGDWMMWVLRRAIDASKEGDEYDRLNRKIARAMCDCIALILDDCDMSEGEAEVLGLVQQRAMGFDFDDIETQRACVIAGFDDPSMALSTPFIHLAAERGDEDIAIWHICMRHAYLTRMSSSREDILKSTERCARIIREHFPIPPFGYAFWVNDG